MVIGSGPNGLAAAYALASRPSPWRGLILGVALGLAFATKFSAVLLIPGVALAFVAVRPETEIRHRWRRAAIALLLAALAATFTIFAIICIGGIVFTLTHVPETTGHSLEAIEAYLESGQPLVALGAAKT